MMLTQRLPAIKDDQDREIKKARISRMRNMVGLGAL